MTEYTRRYSRLPKPLGECVEPVIKPALKDKGLAGSRIIIDWEKIAGAKMASRCVPEKLSFPRGKTTDGTLTIAVENGFATELQHQIPLILERLAIYFGYKAISRITISHTLPKRQVNKKPASQQQLLHNLPQASLDEVHDAELKDALANLRSVFDSAKN